MHLLFCCNTATLDVFATVALSFVYMDTVVLSQKCSNLVGECYEFPAKEKLMQYRIMVTTLLTAGR